MADVTSIFIEYDGQWYSEDFSITLQAGDAIELIGHPFPSSGSEDPSGVYWSFSGGDSGAVSMETTTTTATITAAAAGTQTINCAAVSNPYVELNVHITVEDSVSTVTPIALNLYDASDNTAIDDMAVLEFAPNESRSYHAVMFLSDGSILIPTVTWFLDSSETVYSISGYTDSTVTVLAGNTAGESTNYLFALASYGGVSINTTFKVNVVGEVETAGYIACIYNSTTGEWEEYTPCIYNSSSAEWEEYDPNIYPFE